MDEFTYTYDADGNVLTKDNALDGSLDETYTYDNLNRLTSTTGPTDQSWDLDALGNFDSVTTGGVTQDDTTNAQNELTAAGTQALAYDAAGNMTTDDQGDTLIYDAWNRVVEIKNGSTVLGIYAYDGMGRKITSDEGGTTTDIYYSGMQRIEDQVGGNVMTQYVYSPVYEDAVIERQTHAGGRTGETFSPTETFFMTQDADWNVTATIQLYLVGDTNGDGVVDSSDYTPINANDGTSVAGGPAQGDIDFSGHVDAGDYTLEDSTVLHSTYHVIALVAERYDYTGYGVVTYLNADFSAHSSQTTSAIGQNQLSQGRMLDVATQWYDNGERLYKASIGRFNTVDPSGTPDGVDRYWALVDNPVNRVDPSGFQSTKPVSHDFSAGSEETKWRGEAAGGTIHVYPNAKLDGNASVALIFTSNETDCKDYRWVQEITVSIDGPAPKDKLDRYVAVKYIAKGEVGEKLVKLNEPTVDTGTDSSIFYDASGFGQRSAGESSMGDKVESKEASDLFNPDTVVNREKLKYQADVFLVNATTKKPIWHVTWTAVNGKYEIVASEKIDSFDKWPTLSNPQVLVGHDIEGSYKPIMINNSVYSKSAATSPSTQPSTSPK